MGNDANTVTEYVIKGGLFGGVAGALTGSIGYGAKQILNSVGNSGSYRNLGSTSTELVIYYPPRDGAVAGTQKNIYLMAGDKIDRFGGTTGKYFYKTI